VADIAQISSPAPAAPATIDAELSAKAPSWNKLSREKITELVDWMVIAADPDARPAGRLTPPIREAGYCSHPVQTHRTGQRAANGPRAQPNRGLKMPRRETTTRTNTGQRMAAARAA